MRLKKDGFSRARTRVATAKETIRIKSQVSRVLAGRSRPATNSACRLNETRVSHLCEELSKISPDHGWIGLEFDPDDVGDLAHGARAIAQLPCAASYQVKGVVVAIGRIEEDGLLVQPGGEDFRVGADPRLRACELAVQYRCFEPPLLPG